MARILGLDLGSHSVKGVLIETTLRGHTVRHVAEAPLPLEGERPARLSQAIATLLAEAHGRLAADTITVALPGAALATHPITLPFSDPKKIDATLGFEVEGQLPFDLSEAVYDYQIASATDAGASLNVGVVKKDELGALLELLKAAKVDPRIVTHPGLVLQGLLGVMAHANLPEATGEAVALVDIGHERVTLAIGTPGGAVEFARTFPGGGQALTRALAAEFKIALPEAQAWKEQYGAVGREVVGAEAERAEGAFLRALAPVVRELKSTLKAFTARNKRTVTRLVLSGGTARLKGLPERLGQDLGLAVERLELPAEVVTAAGPLAGPQLALAWALALRGEATGARAQRFNLRRGEFSFRSDLDFVKDRVGQLVAFGAVLLVLLIASGIVRNSVLERREKQVDAALCEVTQRVLGKCEKDANLALNLMQGKESPIAAIPTRSAATLLAEFTQHIPKDMPLTVDNLVIDLDRISVRCETATSKQVEDVITALKAYKCFGEVKEGKLEKSKDGSKVSFRLDIQVQCPDDAAPQG